MGNGGVNMGHGYVVNCIVPSCKRPYRKLTNKSWAGKCPECLKLEQDASMMYEVLEDEIRKNMREMCREIIEAYLYESKEEYKQGLKNIRASFRTETRKLKKEFEESLMEKIGKGSFIENEIKSYTKAFDEKLEKMHNHIVTINTRILKLQKGVKK